MSIRTSSLWYCAPLVLVAACSTDRVVSTPQEDFAPRLSFTGTSVNGRVVFVSDRDYWFSPVRNQIYSVTPEGTDLVRLTGFDVEGDVWVGQWPAVSADGRKIAFTGYQQNGEGGWDIYTMNADGSGKLRLTAHGLDDLTPEWSPDRTQIAFTSARSGSWQLWVMDSLGGNLRQLSTDGSDGPSSWSSDGTKLIYGGFCGRAADPTDVAHGICQVDPAGSAAPVRIVSSGSGSIFTPTWSPSGHRIAFAGTYNGMRAIWTIFPNGTGEHPAVNYEGGGTDPRWSPDGTKIIFMKSFGMLVANPEGSNEYQPFTTNPIGGSYNYTPYWGPAPPPPPAPKQCADGIDNDTDGQTDYPADPGCSGATDDDETDPPPPPPVYQCSDALDNDGDGKIDYPADPGCASATDDNEADKKGGGPTKPPPQCNDGIDNDGDGAIDLADAQCRNSKDNDERR